MEDREGPDAPPPALFPVQLLQRISPWFPFFHMDEEFVLQTAQHGFKPSGIVVASESDAGEPRNSTELTVEMKMLRLCGRDSSGEAETFFLSQFDSKQNGVTLN